MGAQWMHGVLWLASSRLTLFAFLQGGSAIPFWHVQLACPDSHWWPAGHPLEPPISSASLTPNTLAAPPQPGSTTHVHCSTASLGHLHPHRFLMCLLT